MRDRNHGMLRLLCYSLSGAVTCTGLIGVDTRVWNEMHVSPKDAQQILGEHDCSIHLCELGEPLSCELLIDLEPAAHDRLQHRTVSDHDECSRICSNDSLESF